MMRGKIPWDIERPGTYTLREWEIDADRSVLLIMDMQRGYVDPDWGVGKVIKRGYPRIYDYYYGRLAEKVLPNMLMLRDFFRQHKLEVFYTRMGFQLPEARDLPEWNWQRVLLQVQREEDRSLFFKQSGEYEIVRELQPLANELVLDKNSLNAFNSTPLDQVLRNMGLENIVLTGVLTNAAVESTARTVSDRGYNVIVVEDACAAYYQADHEAALRSPSSGTFVVKLTHEVIRDLQSLLMQRNKR